MKSYEYLLVESDAPIAVVTMNRPDRRNAPLARADVGTDRLLSRRWARIRRFARSFWRRTARHSQPGMT